MDMCINKCEHSLLYEIWLYSEWQQIDKNAIPHMTISFFVKFKPSTVGYLRNSSEIFGNFSETFVWPSDNLRKRKSSKNRQKRHCVVGILCNEKKIAWSLADTKFLFLC